MNIFLDTDFRDYYDHRFCGSWQKPDIVFSRKTTDGPDRVGIFNELKKAGLQVPEHGMASDLISRWKSKWKKAGIDNYMGEVQALVVYDDLHAHQGKGKRRLTVDEVEKFGLGNLFAAEFIPTTPGSGSWSLRWLRAGLRRFWLRYTSFDDWRSNYGDVSIELLFEEKRSDSLPKEKSLVWETPLVAVDFINAGPMGLIAVDLNIAPGIQGSGVEKLMLAREVYDEIENFFTSSK